jgi:hypothetical protein
MIRFARRTFLEINFSPKLFAALRQMRRNQALLLEETIKGRPQFIRFGICRFAGGRSTCRGEEVAEISFFFVWSPLGLRLAAFIVRRRVVPLAVHAAMNISAATRTFIGAGNVSLYLDFTLTGITNHAVFSLRNISQASRIVAEAYVEIIGCYFNAPQSACLKLILKGRSASALYRSFPMPCATTLRRFYQPKTYFRSQMMRADRGKERAHPR